MKYLKDSRFNIIEAKEETKDSLVGAIGLFTLMSVMLILVMCI